MRTIAPDLTALWHGTAWNLLTTTAPSMVTSSDIVTYDNELVAKSMEFDFDAGRDLWLPKSRWTKLVRDYVDPDELEMFVDRCAKIAAKDAQRGVVTQMQPRFHDRAVGKYQWGNCIIGWTYRQAGRKAPPVLVMHSRTSYVSYMGGLDLALCYALAVLVGEQTGHAPEEFEFRWRADSLLFHDYKSIPYMLGRDRMMDLMEAARTDPVWNFTPGVKKLRKTFEWIARQDAAGIPWHEEKFGPRKRIRRRHSQWVAGETLPSVPLSSLTFDPLWR